MICSRIRVVLALAAATAATAAVVSAQTPSVTIEPMECLPVGGYAPVYARIGGEPGGSEVRLYFRRLNQEVEDFYWVEMEPTGDGRYYAVLPKPSDEEFEDQQLENPENDDQQKNLEAAWWFMKETTDDRDPNDDLDAKVIEERASEGRTEQRKWLREGKLDELEKWFEEADNEPAEVFVAVLDANDRVMVKSAITPILVKNRNCRMSLTPKEEGFASNLFIGETAQWQEGEPLFHWLCDGVITRVDVQGIRREDEFCRACVVAWWRTNALVPLVATPARRHEA